ncbi:MAG: hypothetical protein ACKVY0_23765 [Prosthecobacter sp.]|uniref:hypothetical protein n=1 Tax=Prosthecobacter sp. TaxID=1965333 RepID=UPI0039011286
MKTISAAELKTLQASVTQPLSFPAVIAAADADHLTGQAQFELDRTQFGRLFAFLGKHVVNDHIHLHVKLHAHSSHHRSA